MNPYSDWYNSIYPQLTGNGLWLRGSELNTIPVEEYENRPFKFLIVRLSTYSDTASSFTHQLLYQISRSDPEIFPDLAYLPPQNDLPFFYRDSIPLLLGTQTKRGAKDFDLVGFSNSIVQELVNLPVMLERSLIPLQKTERLKNPSMPLVILGGANALHTSALWTNDPPVDGIFVGEDDKAIARLLHMCAEGKKNRADKRSILDSMEKVDGFFQPDKIRKTVKARSEVLSDAVFLGNAPVLYTEESAGSGVVQISEGCPCLCSFCSENWQRRPYREVPAPLVLEHAKRIKADMGLEKIELYSFNFNLHSEFYRIVEDMAILFNSVGLKSQRIDMLAADPAMLDFLRGIGKTSLTLGIEGISSRLRRYLHKNLNDAVLYNGLEAVFRARLREVKLFLIATGLENEADYKEFEALLSHIKDIVDQEHVNPRIIFSLTPLVRFPWTPLEFEDAFSEDHYAGIMRQIGRLVQSKGFEYREAGDPAQYWLSQILVRANDPAIYISLCEALTATGFVFFRSVPFSFLQEFKSRLKQKGLDPASFLLAPQNHAVSLPWENIGTGTSREFIRSQNTHAKKNTEIDYCLGWRERSGKCKGCGACTSAEQKKKIIAPRMKRPYTLGHFKKIVDKGKSDRQRIALMVSISEKGRGVLRNYIGACLARAIVKTEPDFIPSYRSFDGSFWTKTDSAPWLIGDDILYLFFTRLAVEKLARLMNEATFVEALNANMQGWGTVKGLAGQAPEKISFTVESPFEFNGNGYFKSLGLKHTLRKSDNNRFACEFTKDSIRKKMLVACEYYNKSDGSSAVALEAGIKFSPIGFLKKAFKISQANDWVRTIMRSSIQ